MTCKDSKVDTWNETIVWHKVKTRQPTEDEARAYYESYEDTLAYVLDCSLPEDGEEILILTRYGVFSDTCVYDEGWWFLDKNGDWEDVIAWAKLPTGGEVQ